MQNVHTANLKCYPYKYTHKLFTHLSVFGLDGATSACMFWRTCSHGDTCVVSLGHIPSVERD